MIQTAFDDCRCSLGAPSYSSTLTASPNLQHGSFLVCDVDAMMEHYAAFIFDGFSEGDAGTSHSM